MAKRYIGYNSLITWQYTVYVDFFPDNKRVTSDSWWLLLPSWSFCCQNLQQKSLPQPTSNLWSFGGYTFTKQKIYLYWLVVSNVFYVHSKFGEDSHFDEYIFQRGWNRQLAFFVYIMVLWPSKIRFFPSTRFFGKKHTSITKGLVACGVFGWHVGWTSFAAWIVTTRILGAIRRLVPMVLGAWKPKAGVFSWWFHHHLLMRAVNNMRGRLFDQSESLFSQGKWGVIKIWVGWIIQRVILPSYIGTRISHDKDPH